MAAYGARYIGCLSLVVWLGACGRSRPTKKEVGPIAEKATPAEPKSMGWQSSMSPDPPTDLERAKLERERIAAAKEVEVPPELAGRPKPKAPAVLDIYVDGTPRTSMVASRFDTPMPLGQALGTLPIRSVLIHAPDHNAWISAPEIGSFNLRRNRRGMVKLELLDMGGRGKGDGTGRATRKPDDPTAPPAGGGHREVRDREIRDVEWIEVRTQTSVRLDNEPR